MTINLWKLALAHKLIAGISAVILVAGGYYAYQSVAGTSVETKYVLAEAQKGNLISSVSGSGQVSAVNEVEIKSKAAGDIVWLGMLAGQDVKKGQILATLDDTDAKKAVYDAETALSEAKLQYDKDSAQAPIDYQKKLETLQTQKNDLESSYEDAFNSVSNVFLDLPSVITGVEDVLYGYNFGSNYWNISYYKSIFNSDASASELVNSLADIADKDYQAARTAYDANFSDFKKISRYSDKQTIEDLLDETIETVKAIAQAAKSETNLLDTVVDLAQRKNQKINSSITSFQTSLKSYVGTANSALSTLLSKQSSLESAKQSVVNTEREISVLRINNPTGDDPIDLQISKNSIAKKEATLADLKSALADYVVRAPFDGVIAKVSVEKLDSISSGASLATIVTKQQLAEISLNEVDAAKVKVGQKVTLTFDAIEDLNLTGTVSEVETVGTVSQGVVTYTVKIIFDAQDSRVKPGMSVSTVIITETKIDVLLVPGSAVKTSGNISYVETPDASEVSGLSDSAKAAGVALKIAPKQQQIEVGSSNDSFIEVISGLKEGDLVVSKSGSAAVKTTTQSADSLRIPGIGGGLGR